MASDSEASIGNNYLLHSVLVHSGEVGVGHYYAYIRPSLGCDYGSTNVSSVPENVTVADTAWSGSDIASCMVGDIDSQAKDLPPCGADGQGGKWFKFNDETVFEVPVREAIDNCFGNTVNRLASGNKSNTIRNVSSALKNQ